VAISGVPGAESGAGYHLKADPRRAERDFVTVNFGEFGLAELPLIGLLRSSGTSKLPRTVGRIHKKFICISSRIHRAFIAT
jgi:hypothetical protein